jgi:hypothetical protein
MSKFGRVGLTTWSSLRFLSSFSRLRYRISGSKVAQCASALRNAFSGVSQSAPNGMGFHFTDPGFAFGVNAEKINYAEARPWSVSAMSRVKSGIEVLQRKYSRYEKSRQLDLGARS